MREIDAQTFHRRSAFAGVRGAQTHISIREARCDDDLRLRQLFYSLSPNTRYTYFGIAIPSSDDWAQRFVALGMPAPNAYAAVAESHGRLMGVARYVINCEGASAEIGIIVGDDWQSQGIGTQLLLRLRAVAQQRAINAFTAHLLAENRRAMRLLRRVFAAATISWCGSDADAYLPFQPETA